MKEGSRPKWSDRDMETLMEEVADYVRFAEPSGDELSEEDLELVTAAAGQSPYQRFVEKIKRREGEKRHE